MEDLVWKQEDLVGTGIMPEEGTAGRLSTRMEKKNPALRNLAPQMLHLCDMLPPSPFFLPGKSPSTDALFALFFSGFLPCATLLSLSVRMNR